MTLPVSKKERDTMRSALNSIMQLTRTKRNQFNINDLLLLYWDEHTLDIVNTVRKGVARSNQLDSSVHEITLTHPVAGHPAYPEGTYNLHLTFKFEQPIGSVATLWPRMNEFRADCDQTKLMALNELLHTVACEAVDRGLFEEVSEFVIENCSTFDAMAYLYPPSLSIMRRGGLRQQANTVEGDVARVPKLPPVPRTMRTKMRHVIQWFAIQELLGTWESQRGARSETAAEVTLLGNHTKIIRTEEGDSFEIRAIA